MDPYELLNVKPTASIDEAEDAYHDLLRVHHPDLHHGGTAEEIAEAELRTRQLNHAMDQIRSGYVSVSSATTTNPNPNTGAYAWAGSDQSSRPSDASWNHTDRSSAWTTAEDGWPRVDRDRPQHESYYGAPHAVTPCPLCGEWFERRDELTLHVKRVHHLRLARERRPSWFGGTWFGRTFSGARHLSLWFVAPFNAVLASIVAALVASNLDVEMSYWVFAVAMSPTFIRILDRPGGGD